jgi:hypothetical protein
MGGEALICVWGPIGSSWDAVQGLVLLFIRRQVGVGM